MHSSKPSSRPASFVVDDGNPKRRALGARGREKRASLLKSEVRRRLTERLFVRNRRSSGSREVNNRGGDEAEEAEEDERGRA